MLYRCKEVDWLNDFLPKVMDVLATHIRLYKSPVTQLVQVKPHESVKEYADHLTDQTKVSEQFFELDSSGICKIKYTRRKIFEDKELEKGNYIMYVAAAQWTSNLLGNLFQDTLKVIGDAILWLASPVFEFKNRLLELLASQILVGGIILPNLASTVDPDYLNQLVIWMVTKVQVQQLSLASFNIF